MKRAGREFRGRLRHCSGRVWSGVFVALLVLGAGGCSDGAGAGGWGFGGGDARSDGGTPSPADTAGDGVDSGADGFERSSCENPEPEPQFSNCGGSLPGETSFGWESGHTPPTDLVVGPTGCPQFVYHQGERVEYASATADGWETETVGRTKEVSDSSHKLSNLAVDSCGRSSVAIRNAKRIILARRSADGTWQPTVLRIGTSRGRVLHAFDPNDRPVVVDERVRNEGDGDRETHAVVYAFRGNDGWRRERVFESGSHIDLQEGLKFDSRGRAHLAFTVDRQGVHHAVRRSAGQWDVERVDELDSVQGVNLAIGSGDTPHLVSCTGVVSGDTAVVHFRRAAGGWRRDEVSAGSSDQAWCRTAAADRRGRVHTVYIANVGPALDYELRHVVWNGNDSQTRTLGTRGYRRNAPRIVPDVDAGVVHVLFMADPADGGANLETYYRQYPLSE